MIACASAVARTAPLLSTRGASMPQCLRAHIPFPFADAGSSCEALSHVAHFGLQTLDGRSVRRGYPLKSAS